MGRRTAMRRNRPESRCCNEGSLTNERDDLDGSRTERSDDEPLIK